MKKKKQVKAKAEKPVTKLAGKVDLAMNHEFYLEALLILSEMFENKLKKLIDQIENQHPGIGFTLEQSIKRVKYLHVSSKYPDFSAHFNVGLIDEIRNWKNQRNDILKDLTGIHVSKARLERLAMEGTRLITELKKAGKAMKAA